MARILTCIIAALMSFSVSADHHGAVETEVLEAVKAFNGDYESNDVDAYFSHYADDATLYFFGARQDVSAYHKQWAETVSAGGAVVKYTLSDIKIQVLPSRDVAVATYFIDFQMRLPDGQASASRAFETDVWQKIDGNWKVASLHYTEIPPE